MALGTKPYTTPIQRASLDIAAKRVAQKLRVFLAGPYVNKTWKPDELELQSSAAKMRLSIRSHIEEQLQHEVILGEHRGVPEMGAEQFGTQASFAIAEYVLVNDAHAIIMIPASAGSFCELGSWSISEDLCRKMLVIADRQYAEDISYLRLGTLRMAINHGATVAWCDMDDDNEVMGHVGKFVQAAHDRLMVRLVTRGE